MSRLRADTMPAVTVPPRLNGLPIAITHSPSRSLSESPNFTALSGLSGFTRSSARSVFWSRPISSALSSRAVVEDDVDLVGVGDDVVVGDDDAGRIDDEAGAERVDAARRAIGVALSPPWPRRFLKNSSKNSSNGEPGGSCGIGAALPRASTFCEVEILTTASITCSATSAMFSGPRACAGAARGGSAIAAARERGQQPAAGAARARASEASGP